MSEYFNLGFSGSRELGVPPHVITAKIEAIIDKAFDSQPNLVKVHVGDADGVDALVIDLCLKRGYPVTVYGIMNKYRNPKNLAAYQDGMLFLDYPSDLPRITYVSAFEGDYQNDAYLQRDRVLVESIDAIYGLWNGHSRGTKYTIDYARKWRKRAYMLTIEPVRRHAEMDEYYG